MLSFLSLIISLASIGVAIYVAYTIAMAQRASKKYEQAKEKYAETIETEYTQMLGGEDDGNVYLDWGLDILQQKERHQMFSYDDAIEKIRKACELLDGDDKKTAENALCNVMHRKYFDEYTDSEELAKELDELYSKELYSDSPMFFYYDKANFKSEKGDRENNAEDLLTALQLYAKVEEMYPQASEEDQKRIDLKNLKSNEIDTLIDLISSCKQYEYLDELYSKLVERKDMAVSYDAYVQMDFARYYSLRYVHLKEKADLEKIDEICQEALNIRSINKNRSEIYSYWASFYQSMGTKLKDDVFLEMAKEKYKEAIDLDKQNVQAVKNLVNLYSIKGLETKTSEPLAQAIEILLESNEALYFVEDKYDNEAVMENQTARIEFLIEAVKLVRYSEAIDKASPNRKQLDKIGSEITLLLPTQRMGYIIKAEGMLFTTVTENTFAKNKKSILRNLQKESDPNSPIIAIDMDNAVNYIYAGYYAQIPEEEDKMYEYMDKYIKSYEGSSGKKELLEEMKKDPLFANFRHSMRFSELFK